jgi:hypothetical protein
MPGGTNKSPLSVLTFSTKITVINKEKEAKRKLQQSIIICDICCHKPKGGTKQPLHLQIKQKRDCVEQNQSAILRLFRHTNQPIVD